MGGYPETKMMASEKQGNSMVGAGNVLLLSFLVLLAGQIIKMT